MEYIDVLDKNGNPTGEKKSNPDIHRSGDWHKAVHVWVINEKEELLIQKRAPNKPAHPNAWGISAAGQVSSEESSIDSAVRETQEEIGIRATKDKFEYLFSVTEQTVLNNGTYINNEFDSVYLLKILSDTPIIFQDGEVTEVKWLDFRELEKRVHDGDESLVPHDEEYRKLFAELHKRYS